MIRWTNLSLRRGAKLLLEDISAVIQPGEKVGLVGANGSGKSSLFALLRGELHADQGDFTMPASWRIAHVAQETAASQSSALDFTIDGDRHLRELEAEIEAKTHGTSSDHGLAELHMAYGDAGGYTAPSRAEALLLGLGFTLEQTQRPVVTFSGGWRMRLQLAQALMSPSDLLLLDEPTNHLDLDAIVWLEQWLKRYAGTLIIVSHDREFLDAVCNVTLALEQKKLTRWTGNYTAYELQRVERLRLTQSAYSKQQREITHLQYFVDRFRAKATKAKQAQSRVKAMERMTLIAPVINASPFTFKFRAPLASPDPMLVLEDVDCGYHVDTGVSAIVRDVSLRLSVGERIGRLGANGQGKSTLIKTIAGTLERLSGTMTKGKGLAIGYFAQHQIDMLALDSSPLEQLSRIAARTGAAPREQELRDYLGSFDFRGEMATVAVAPFSGGEKARLALALIIWTKPNLLLLDEPTNHLDLETREALTLALAQFEGTLILVSHDRSLLRATTDRFLLVSEGRCSEFDGDLDDYRAWSLKKTSGVEVAAKAEPVDGGKRGDKGGSERGSEGRRAVSVPTAINTRDQRRLDAAARDAIVRHKRPIEQRIRRIEARLAEADEKKRAIETALSLPDAYADEHRERLKQQLIEQAYVTRAIEQLEADWLEQHALLEQAA
ncbi:MAG: ABC-F family ATP-binding cassette domain-containing protein [Burkholderiaceae bacterium]